MLITTLTGSDFEGLQEYLTGNREHAVCGTSGISTAEAAGAEMALVAAQHTRVQKPVLHVVFAPAPEDQVQMTPALWAELATDFEREFGLEGHQHLVVEHPHRKRPLSSDAPPNADRHRHLVYNKVHPESFRLPTGGSKKSGSWDTSMTQRAWQVGDNFAARHGLRRVPSPITAVKSRTEQGADVRISASSLKREERTGIRPLSERAPQLRAALEHDLWEERIIALARVCVQIIPKRTGDGDILGISFADAHETGERLKGSRVGKAFSYDALEKSRRPGSPTLDEALRATDKSKMAIAESERQLPSSPLRELYHLDYRAYQSEWEKERRRLQRKRKEVLEAQRQERKRLSRELVRERDGVLDRTPSQFHRQSRTAFRLLTSEPRRGELQTRHRAELDALSTPSKLSWKDWLEAKVHAGDASAEIVLNEMRARHRGHRQAASAKKAARQAVGRVQEVEPSSVDHERESRPRAVLREAEPAPQKGHVLVPEQEQDSDREISMVEYVHRHGWNRGGGRVR